jgi:protein SCO1/2
MFKRRTTFFIMMSIIVVPVVLFFVLRSSTTVCRKLRVVVPELDANGEIKLSASGDTLAHPVPPFRFMNERGQSITDDSLRGYIHIADFIFTTCPTICKDLSANMANLQRRIKDKYPYIKLVSYTVDPKVDTPPVLAEYAKRYEAVAGQWMFLTGSEDSLHKHIIEGYKVPCYKTPQGDMKVTHSDLLVLVDPDLRYRGFYRILDPRLGGREFERLMEEIDVLRCEFRGRIKDHPVHPLQKASLVQSIFGIPAHESDPTYHSHSRFGFTGCPLQRSAQ